MANILRCCGTVMQYDPAAMFSKCHLCGMMISDKFLKEVASMKDKNENRPKVEIGQQWRCLKGVKVLVGFIEYDVRPGHEYPHTAWSRDWMTTMYIAKDGGAHPNWTYVGTEANTKQSTNETESAEDARDTVDAAKVQPYKITPSSSNPLAKRIRKAAFAMASGAFMPGIKPTSTESPWPGSDHDDHGFDFEVNAEPKRERGQPSANLVLDGAVTVKLCAVCNGDWPCDRCQPKTGKIHPWISRSTEGDKLRNLHRQQAMADLDRPMPARGKR